MIRIMPNKTCSFRVKGLVQGVFFRQSTKQQADRLGLRGWVKNVPEGDVIGEISGDSASLDTFQAWLKQGPAMACVTALEWREIQAHNHEGFQIR